MTLPETPAPRLRRPSWRDPRLTVGVVLVALAVSLGSWAVSSAGHTVPVYVAASALTPGESVELAVLRVVEVRLDSGLDRYLRADQPLPGGLTVARTVPEGELVPVSALGAAAEADLRSVAVPLASGLSDRIRPGTVVDLWFVPVPGGPVDAAPGPEPRLLAGQVVVEQVDVPDGALVVAGAATVHALIPTDSLPGVLTALAAAGTAGAGGGTLAIVPAAGAGA